MEKLLDTMADILADKVLEKLLAGEKMKQFLSGKMPSLSIDDIEGARRAIEDSVQERWDKHVTSVDADDVDGLEKFVENCIEETLKNVSLSVG